MPTGGQITTGGKVGQIAALAVIADLDNPTAQESQIRQVANLAWYSVFGDPALPVWESGIISIQPGILPTQAKAKPGQIIFAEYKGGTSWEIRARLQWPSQQAATETYLAVLQNLQLPASADQFQPVEDKKLSIGLGLFNLWIPDFLPNLPPIVWLLIALFSGYSTYRSKKIVPRIAYGAVTWIAAAKFVQSNQKNIKL